MRKHLLLSGYLLACLLGFAALSLSAAAQTTASYEWTWMGGNNTVPNDSGQPGVYGTLGSFAIGNIPVGRNGGTSWTDSEGKLWLFGGSSADAYGVGGELNDVWEFDPALNEWAWMGGSNTTNQSGFYGTQGAPAKNNIPGGRSYALGWADNAGDFWLFGGNGYDDSGNSGQLNDLWKFNSETNEWTWMGGSSTLSCVSKPSQVTECGQPSVYGTLETPAAGNVPAGRYSSAGWTDKDGNFWLFGGCNDYECASFLNDLWKFDPSTNEWAWMGGSSAIDISGVYGTLGTPAAGNVPGSRYGASCWTDNSGHLWLYGGEGYDSTDNVVFLNDLWEFDPSTIEWTWRGGSSTVGSANALGAVYSILGTPASGSTPGSRSNAASWTDSSGNFWLMGGVFNSYSNPSTIYNFGEYNDLWEFSPSANEWAWMGGTDSPACVAYGCSHPVVYGTAKTPASINFPGYREGASSWTDSSDYLWLFGGSGYDAVGNLGQLSDIWIYQPVSATFPAAEPIFSLAAGTYTTTQTVTIADATAGATIYYTTNGTTPTTASSVYSSPVIVSSTETLEALATASGYSISAVANATYTIPPDFSIAINPASVSVQAGQSGTTTITVQDEGGFNGNVSFACSGLPARAACIFTLETVPTPAGISYSTLTVTTSATNAALRRNSNPLIPGSALAVALCCFGWKKRRRLPMLLLLAVSVAGLSLFTGCSSAASSTQPTTSTVTVTATSGSLKPTATFSLTVN